MRDRRGTTLLEVLTGAVVLSLVAVPLAMLLTSSSRAVRGVDRNREIRSLMEQIVQRVESTDLTVLWDNYGIEPDSPSRLDGKVAEFDPASGPGLNPLLLDRPLLERLHSLKLRCDLRYKFMTRDQLGVDAENRLKSSSGLLHLQAGVATLRIQGKVEGRDVDEEVVRPIYCPMIIGKPGLLLSQCPAVNPALRDGKFAHIP